MIITYYDLTESQVKAKAYSAGSLYCCSDTGNIFLDSVLEEVRVQLATDVIICTSLPLAPAANKLYCNVAVGTISTYVDGEWVTLGARPQMHFGNVVISGGTLTVSDSRILSTDTAVFVPDLSVADIAGTISVRVANGSITVTSNSEYDIPGEVIIN